MIRKSRNPNAIFYTRDSGGRHEMTPAQYIEWAIKKSKDLALGFAGTTSMIEQMIKDGRFHLNAIYLDFGVKGHIASRPGLDAFIERLRNDKTITHVLIPKRERLMRPECLMEGILLEQKILDLGVTLVFQNRVIDPAETGSQMGIDYYIVAAVDYEQSGGARVDLAEKVIQAQIQLAKRGFSTGGKAPYGFKRCLVDDRGKPVRDLKDGERVKMKRHHVVHLQDESQLVVINEIIDLLEHHSKSSVRRILKERGIPSPEAGKVRKKNKIPYVVSDDWPVNTIEAVIRNPMLLGLAVYGRRNYGDCRRMTRKGPRKLTEADFDERRRIAFTDNAEENQIKTETGFGAVVDVDKLQRVLKKLDANAGIQKNTSRRVKGPNPLGNRVFDLDCGHPMYRSTYQDSYRYRCSLYESSHGASCNHNTVSGPSATAFALGVIKQRLMQPHTIGQLEQKIRQIAERDLESGKGQQRLVQLQAQYRENQSNLQLVKTNLARAKNELQYEAVAEAFEELTKESKDLVDKIEQAKTDQTGLKDVESEVKLALQTIEQLDKFTDVQSGDIEAARELIEIVNAQMYLQFKRVTRRKRVVNRLAAGVITLGAVAPPTQLYDGASDRKSIKALAGRTGKKNPGSENSDPGNFVFPSGDAHSLGNVSCGDRI